MGDEETTATATADNDVRDAAWDLRRLSEGTPHASEGRRLANQVIAMANMLAPPPIDRERAQMNRAAYKSRQAAHNERYWSSAEGRKAKAKRKQSRRSRTRNKRGRGK